MNTLELPLLQPQIHEFKISRKQSVLSNYDPSAYPPDLQFARNHAKAQKIGQYIPPKQDVQRCPCCLQPIYKPSLKINCSLRELLHIGCAYAFYFHFIKQCIVLVAVNFLICSLPSLIINLTQGNMCNKLNAHIAQFYSTICKLSVINIMNVSQIDMLQIQAIINFISIIVSIILIGIFDIKITNQYKKYENDYNILPKASDYSVLINGLSKDITISQIQQFIMNKIKQTNQQDQTVLKIYLIYNLKIYYALYSNKNNIISQINILQQKYHHICQSISLFNGKESIYFINKLNKQKIDTSQRIGELQNKKQMIQVEINNYQELFQFTTNRISNHQPIEPIQQKSKKQEKIKNINATIDTNNISTMKLKFSGKCIVTLNSKSSKQALTQQTRNSFFLQKVGHQLGQFLGGTSTTITIIDAPQPSQIIYSNIGSQKLRIWTQSICVTTSLFLLILLDFIILTFQKKLIKQQKSINNSNIILSFINSQLISLFNSLVSRIIRISQSKSQMHSTQSSYYYSVTSKLVLLYLINMLVTTFFSNLVNYYFIKQQTGTFQRFPLNFQEYLLDIFFLIITNPFSSIFLIFFDHRQGYKYYKRYQIQYKNYPATQAQANLYFQNMQIDLSNKYSNIYRFVLFSAGVCFIFPPAFLICLIALIIIYWQDKYLLLRRYVVAHRLNFRLTQKLQKLMWSFPLMMSLTNLMIMFVPIQDGKAFKQQKYSKAFYYLSIISLIISIIIFFGGCKWIIIILNKIFYKQQINIQRKRPQYKNIQKDFEQDYWHYYPYFKLKKRQQNTDQNGSISPRKQKVEQLKKKMGMDVFSVIKNHLHHDLYSPIV